jgi:hypothetical protein
MSGQLFIGYNTDDASITITTDDDLVLYPSNSIYPGSNIYPSSSFNLTRYSIRDNFTEGTLLTTDFNRSNSFVDYCVESGIVYKYSYNNGAGYTHAIMTYDGSWLYGVYNNKQVQVNIIYDENMSNFTEVVKDSVVETIGSKYPFIIRQASTKYKKISFSGSINFEMNNQTLSLLNGSNYGSFFNADTSVDAIYNNFIYNNRISYNNNYVAEKLFRENIIKFFNDGKPKLLKTSAEGLFLIRLTNLSFAPNKSLGRMIYNFSCELIEIADSSITNLKKYGVLL